MPITLLLSFGVGVVFAGVGEGSVVGKTDGDGVGYAGTTDGGVGTTPGSTFGGRWVVVTQEDEDCGCGCDEDEGEDYDDGDEGYIWIGG